MPTPRMAAAAVLTLLAVAAVAVAAVAVEAPRAAEDDDAELRFPEGFIIGAGSSAYQIEGAWDQNGKGISTVDMAYNKRPDGGGQVACDSYHHYKEDVAMLKLMGASHFRFSISWARLLPTGKADNVSEDGKQYYTKLLDELEKNGIQPLVTLWHVDMPLTLETEFGGWQDERIVAYFEAYAVTAFRLFGDRVRYWTTLNEPHMFCVYGAGHGLMGATRVRPGWSEYRCGHNVLLAHARAYRAYKQQFSHQNGMIGMALDNYFTRPCSVDYDDVVAAERHQQFELGWFLDPILGDGDYPPMMRQRIDADRLPTFTETQRNEIKGSLDYIGLNSYYGWSACNGVPAGAREPSFEWDQAVVIPEAKNQSNPPGDFQWSPWSIRSSLLWIRDRYEPAGSVPIIITENGKDTNGETGLNDVDRILYLSAWMQQMMRARYEDKINLIGYFVWSLLDDFEWGAGYTPKLGLVHVDFSSPNRTRTPKESLYFMKKVIADRKVQVVVPSSSVKPSLSVAVLFMSFCHSIYNKNSFFP